MTYSPTDRLDRQFLSPIDHGYYVSLISYSIDLRFPVSGGSADYFTGFETATRLLFTRIQDGRFPNLGSIQVQTLRPYQLSHEAHEK